MSKINLISANLSEKLPLKHFYLLHDCSRAVPNVLFSKCMLKDSKQTSERRVEQEAGTYFQLRGRLFVSLIQSGK